MKQLLTDEIVEVTIEKTINWIRVIGDEYSQGIRTDRECFEYMYDAFWKGFYGLLKDNQIKIHINEKNYEQFSKDYQAYQQGNLTEISDNHNPWLVYDADVSCEVSIQDKKQFFYLMETYHLTPEYFTPIPDNLMQPERIYIHGWHDAEAYGIKFNCIDDDNLLSDSEPVGKTFRLVNDIGLEAVLTIKEDRRNTSKERYDFDEDIICYLGRRAEYLAEGYIEGYTARERSDSASVLIRTYKGKINWLAYLQTRDDQEAINSFPLWQEFYGAINERHKKNMKILRSFFDEL